MTAVVLIAVVGAGVVLVGGMYWAGTWILRPLSQEAQLARLPTRYTLSDFAWLMVMLQMALGATVATAPESTFSGVRMVLGLFLGGTAVALWAFGINSLSRAGVTRPLRRGVFTVFLLPATVAFLMATLMGAVACLFAAAHVAVQGFRGENAGVVWVVLGGVVLWPLIAWALRQVAEWVLRP